MANPEQNEPQPLEEQQLAAQAQWESSRYNPDISRFPEMLDPKQVRSAATRLRDAWLKDFYERGDPANQYTAKQIFDSANGKITDLLEGMPLGEHNFIESEKSAGLTAGLVVQQVPLELMTNPAVTFDQLDADNPTATRFWRENGRPIGIYLDDSHLSEDPDKARHRKYIGRIVTEAEAERNRETLADEIEQQVKALAAVYNLLEKTNEQDKFSADQDNYVMREFFQIGKAIMRGHNYREIFNLPPTREGFAPMGEKIVSAYEAFRDITEGRAVVEVSYPDPNNPGELITENRILLNPYAFPKNRGLMDFCLKYIQQRVAAEKPSIISEEKRGKAMQRAEDRDNMSAALMAFVLMDHLDNDAASAVQLLRQGDLAGISGEISMEGAFADSFKLMHPSLRRQMEAWGYTTLNPKGLDERRKHPREVGARATIEALPRLSSHMLDVVKVDVIGTNVKTGKQKVIQVTLDQKAFGARGKDGEREVSELDGKKYSRVYKAKDSSKKSDEDLYSYEVTSLADRSIWDNFSLLVGKGEDGTLRSVTPDELAGFNAVPTKGMTLAQIEGIAKTQLDIIQGTNSLPYEIPKGLFEMYALSGVMNEFMRTDLLKQYSEYKTGETLKTLNKKISLGTKALVEAYQLSGDTVAKLEEYLRIHLVAGLMSVLFREENEGKTKETQIAYVPLGSKTQTGQEISLMANAMFVAGFVDTKSDENGKLSWKNDPDKKLFENIIKKRDKGPYNPFNLPEGSKDYFTPSQLEELKPLYYR